MSFFEFVGLIQVSHMLVACQVHKRMLIEEKFMLFVGNLIEIANVLWEWNWYK